MTYSKGLEGIVAGETAISNVEGELGRLTYRGQDIVDLVHRDYEEVVWLVLFGNFPDEHQKGLLSRLLLEAELTSSEKAVLDEFPVGMHPMSVLQGMLPVMDDQAADFAGEPEISSGLPMIAKLPEVLVHYRARQLGKKVPDLNGETSLARFLARFTGVQPDQKSASVLNVLQILQMEHSFNASTFTARVAGSTLAPVASVLSAAVGALYGRLHGGADEAAMRDALVVGSPDRAPGFIDELFLRKGKLMGMGHREYRTIDPRSKILKPLARALCEGTEQETLFLTLAALEAVFHQKMKERGKEVWANIEFYKGPTLQAIGIVPEYFTAVFAMSRSVGWLAHLAESRRDNRIIRPKARYIGVQAA